MKKFNQKNRKAQIQNMESIAVVIIIGILIVLGIVFAFKQKSSDFVEEKEKFAELDGMTISLRASNLKELKCSSFSNSGNEVCIDLYKLRALEQRVKPENFETYRYYNNLFKKSEIAVRLIYPKREGVETITIYSYNNTNVDTLQTTFFPVLVYDPVKKENIFAMMEIKVFS
jgi:hypothetical protein